MHFSKTCLILATMLNGFSLGDEDSEKVCTSAYGETSTFTGFAEVQGWKPLYASVEPGRREIWAHEIRLIFADLYEIRDAKKQFSGSDSVMWKAKSIGDEVNVQVQNLLGVPQTGDLVGVCQLGSRTKLFMADSL